MELESEKQNVAFSLCSGLIDGGYVLRTQNSLIYKS